MPLPDETRVYPRPGHTQTVYLKNVITRPGIEVGDFTIYNDFRNDPRAFQDNNVLYHYPMNHDRLIIGKFCAIGKGVEFVMNGANHRMNSPTTYPFNIMGGGWEQFTPALEELPFKGDTVVGNDVWIGQHVTVLPGTKIGDGAIIGANSVVSGEIPPYTVAAGNPCRVVRPRFDLELTAYLLELKWWDWDADRIFRHMDALCSSDLKKIWRIPR